MRTLFLALLTLLPLAAFTSCGESPTEPPIKLPAESEPVLFSKHIQPIFQRSCSGEGCHMNGHSGGTLKLDTWDDVVAGSKTSGAVVPFAGSKSMLFQHINTEGYLGPIAEPRMPVSRDPLPVEQIEAIKRWIDEGAKNDAGAIPYDGADRPRIFITAQGEDQITVLDRQRSVVARYIPVGSRPDSSTPPESPHNILLSPDGRFLYVNLIAAGMVEKFDAHTFARLGEVRVGRNPAQLVVTEDGSTLYVSNFDQVLFERFILRVDAGSMTVTDTVSSDTLKAPHSLALSRDEKKLYVANASGDNISEIDLVNLRVERTIQISPGLVPIGKPRYEPYHVLLSEDGKRLYVSCRLAGDVRVIDIESGEVIDSVATGKRPQIIALEPGGGRLWVPHQGDNTVAIVDVESWEVESVVSKLVEQPHAIAFSPDGRKAYVTCENQGGAGGTHHPTQGNAAIPGILYIIDVNTLRIEKNLDVGAFAAGIAVGG